MVGSGRTIPHGARALVGLAALVGAFGLIAAWITPAIGDAASVRARIDNALSRWSGGDFTITGPIELAYFPGISLKASGFSLTSNRVPLVERIEAEHAAFALSLMELLRGRLVITGLTLDKPRIRLREQRANGVAPDERVAALLLDLPVDSIHITDGTVAFETPAGLQTFDALNTDLVFNGSSGALSAEGAFKWRSEPIDFKLRGGRLALSRKEARIPVRLTVSSAPLTAEFEGNVRANDDVSYDGRLDVSFDDVRRSLRWWGFAMPDGTALRSFRARGRMQWTGTTIAFEDGTYSLDGNTAVGTLAVKVDGDRPRLEGTLAFEQISLAPYLASMGPDLNQTNPIDMPLIRHFDADVRISANKVDAAGLTISEAALTLSMADDVLQGDFAELSVCGGSGNAKLTVDAREPVSKLRIDGVLHGVTPDGCVGDIAVEGLSNLKANVTAEGRNGAELLASASGDMATQVTQGEVEVDILRLVTDVEQGVQHGWADGRTPFDSLAAECHMQNGHVYCPVFSMKLPRGTIVGRGGINLPDRNVDWTVSVQGEPAGNAQAAPQAGLKGLLISGPWNEPTIRRPLSTGAADPAGPGAIPRAHASVRLAPSLSH